MTALESFQSRSFRLALDTLAMYRDLKRVGNVPPHLLTQMLRAGTSVGANLEEAKRTVTRRELAGKHAIALREASECGFWLKLIAVDQPKCAERALALADECGQMAAILCASVRKLRAKP